MLFETVLLQLGIPLIIVLLLDGFQLHLEHSLQRSLTSLREHPLQSLIGMADTVGVVAVTEFQVSD